jgi:hypothetical protein
MIFDEVFNTNSDRCAHAIVSSYRGNESLSQLISAARIAQRLALVRCGTDVRTARVLLCVLRVHGILEQVLCCETYAGASRGIHAIQRLPADGWQTIKIRKRNNQRPECPSGELDIWR